MTCKDCIHNDMCCFTHTNKSPICCDFKDKSRFIELPCKVGADVFYPAIYSGIGEYIHVGRVVNFAVYGAVRFCAIYDDGLTLWHKAANIGKTIFFTREEAEKALKQMGKNEQDI